MMRVRDIKTDPALSGIFAIQKEILTAIIQSIKESGYDKAEPIVIWKGRNIVVDGHTRLQAAREAGIVEVPVEEKEFATLEEAKRYSYKRQAERRNLSQAEIFAAATELQNKTERDGTGRASELLAKELGISPATIQHARSVSAAATPEIIDKVKQNKLTINQAYKEIKKDKHIKAKSDFEYVKISIHKTNLRIAEQNSMIKEIFNTVFSTILDFKRNGKISTELYQDITELLKPLTGKVIEDTMAESDTTGVSIEL
jgi:ParB family chromosome partitioning protein